MQNVNRIQSLDGIRGIAILMVIIGHGLGSFSSQLRPALSHIGNGGLGVLIFFVLSGFLIHKISLREYEKTGGFSFRDFYIRRVLRIFPAFHFYLSVLAFLIFTKQVDISWPMFAFASMFAINYSVFFNLGASPDYHAIGHYWTLCLEEQFYLTWPLLMAVMMRKKLMTFLLIIVLTAPFIRIFSYYHQPESRGQLVMMFHTGFDAIASGVLLGELLRRKSWASFLYNFSSKWWVTMGSIIWLLILDPMLNGYIRGFDICLGRSISYVFVWVLIIAAVDAENNWWKRFLSFKPLVFIGVISYSMYIWNNLIFFGTKGSWINHFHLFPCNYIAVFTAALFSHFIIEKPFLVLKKNFSKRAAPNIKPNILQEQFPNP